MTLPDCLATLLTRAVGPMRWYNTVLLPRKFLAVLGVLSLALVLPSVEAKSRSKTAKHSVAHGKKKTVAPSRRTKLARSSSQRGPTQERYMEIQRALAEKGYFTGPVNGSWGPESVQALTRFQEEQNLKPDGKLGSLTLIALGLGPKRETHPLLAKPQPE